MMQKTFKIKSESQPGVEWIVTASYDDVDSDDVGEWQWSCTCPATVDFCKHIRKAILMVTGQADQEIVINVDGPILKYFKSDKHYSLEMEIGGDGKEGIPQSEAVTRLVSWQGCQVEATFKLKSK